MKGKSTPLPPRIAKMDDKQSKKPAAKGKPFGKRKAKKGGK